MKQTIHCGFTLIELLIVIAIIGILAAVLLPTLLSSRAKASDAAAAAVGRQALNSMAVVEANVNGTKFSSCSLSGGVISFKSVTGSNPEVLTDVKVNAKAPITAVTCDATDPDKFIATIAYNAGTAGKSPITVSSAK